jgi:hypothetical protein
VLFQNDVEFLEKEKGLLVTANVLDIKEASQLLYNYGANTNR